MDTNVAVHARDVSAVLFGACLLHGPINQVLRDGKHKFTIAQIALKGSLGASYSFGEMFQKIALLRGEIELPDEIKMLNAISSDFERLPPQPAPLADTRSLCRHPRRLEGMCVKIGTILGVCQSLSAAECRRV